MARISDEKLATLEAPYLLGDIGTRADVIMDLRDARALLREADWVLQWLEMTEGREIRDRIRQHLEGKDAAT